MKIENIKVGDTLIAHTAFRNAAKYFPWAYWEVGQEFMVMVHHINSIGVLPKINGEYAENPWGRSYCVWLYSKDSWKCERKGSMLASLENLIGRCVKYCERKGWL